MDSETQLYTIKDLADITGIKPVTLRAWERRYNLVSPLRSPKGHRLYEQKDIDVITRVQDWLSRGVPISKVANMLESQESDHGVSALTEAALPEVNELLVSLSNYQLAKAQSLVTQAFKEYPVGVVFERLYQPCCQSISMLPAQTQSLVSSMFRAMVLKELDRETLMSSKGAGKQNVIVATLRGGQRLDALFWASMQSRPDGSLSVCEQVNSPLSLLPLLQQSKVSLVMLYLLEEDGKQIRDQVAQLKAEFAERFIVNDTFVTPKEG